MTLALASGYDLAIVVILAIVGLFTLIFVGRLTFTMRGIKVTAERNEAHVVDLKETVGEANGNGAVTTMQARTLGELAELAKKVSELNARLEERTHIVRHGQSEPEELASYTQDRLHDVLSAIAVIKLQLDTLWTFLKDDYPLPDLPSLNIRPTDPSGG
jgi:hypothetical protein